MPENNPFSILTDTDNPATSELAPKLSAHDALFAELGLNPPNRTEPTYQRDHFLEATDLNKTEDVVDAIFTSTETETAPTHTAEATTEATTPTELSPSFAEPESTAEAMQTTVAPEPAGQPLTTITEQATETMEPASHESTYSAALKSLDHAGLEPVVAAYTDLQQKLAANQTLISAEREAIAELRNHMRQLNALGHELTDNHEGLDLGRRLIQADSCENLMRSISQVNEAIQQDTHRAAQLMTPIKTGVEILELRIKHINAIENLVAHMEEGLILQKQLSGADTLIHDLAKHLGLALN